MATCGYHGDTSDEIFDSICSPCAEQNNKRKAIRYCVECQDYYCQMCTDMHKTFPAMKGHKLLNKAEFKASGQQASQPQVPTERCNIHNTKLVDMYCRDHDEVGCTLCMAEKHRSCKAVVTVMDVMNTSGPRNQNDALTKQLTSLIELCKRIQSDTVQDISDADKAEQKAIYEIKKQRKELDNVLDQLENASRHHVERVHKKLCTESKEVNERVKQFEAKLQKHVTSLRSSKGNAAQQFVYEKLGHKDFNEVTDATNTIEQADKISFEFTADPSIYQNLSQHKSLGTVKHITATVSKPKTTLYKIKGTNTLTIKHKEDKSSCDINGCCFFDPGCILLADYSNTSLKRVNMQTQSVTDHCNMPDSPISVCCVNTSEAAVTLYNYTIQFVSIHCHMTITRQVKLDHICFGIACADEKVYVTDEDKTLYIYDLYGTPVKKVKTNTLGNDIFTNNRSATYNTYNGNVYVVDVSGKIVCFNQNGNYKWNLTHEIFNTPQGVCTDGRGNVFVCSWGSGNVVQIGSDGKLFGEVVSASCRLGSAWSVCFDKINNRLSVTTSGNDKIFIFELE